MSGGVLSSLIFSWTRRRYSFRAGFFYYTVSISILVAVLITLTLAKLMKTYSYFVNYVCTAPAFHNVLHNFTAKMIFGSVIIVTSFAIGRLTLMFSNYSIANFSALGEWSNRLGFFVKWLPWVVSCTALLWVGLEIFNWGLLVISPASWCIERWTDLGTVAVRNCRMYYKIYHTGCAIVATEWHLNVYRCNDKGYIVEHQWDMFSGETIETCSVSSRMVCLAAQALVEDIHVDWSIPDLANCSGSNYDSTVAEKLIVKNSKSDLHRYLQLYIIIWSMIFVFVCASFFYIKTATPFDAAFHQTTDINDNILIKAIRPLTPWSR